MRALKMSVVAGHSEGDNDLLRAVIKANPLKTVWEIAEKQNVNHSMVILHLKQIGNVKKFVSVCLMRWLQTQTFVILKCLLLFYATTSHFSTGLWCAMKSEFYTTTSNNQLQWLDQEKAPRHFPKTHLHQKEVMVTVWWSAADLIHYSFLNPSETITSEKYAQ